MSVRKATAKDILIIVDYIECLRTAIGGPVQVDREYTAATIARLIASSDGLVLISDGGFIAAILQQTMISPSLIALECGWYASDGSGRKLLEAYEGWARERGATLIQLSTGPTGPDLTRLGYRRAEQAWIKT